MDQRQKLAEIRFPAKSDQLKRMRNELREIVEQQRCFSADTLHCIVLAVDEACSNIIRHAYGKECDSEILIEVFREPSEMVFRLTDYAVPVDTGVVRPRIVDRLRPGGLGVYLIHKIMDKVAFVDCPAGAGNVLELRKKIHDL
jgi:phosphoserine phosphatase RsbU/P